VVWVVSMMRRWNVLVVCGMRGISSSKRKEVVDEEEENGSDSSTQSRHNKHIFPRSSSWEIRETRKRKRNGCVVTYLPNYNPDKSRTQWSLVHIHVH